MLMSCTEMYVSTKSIHVYQVDLCGFLSFFDFIVGKVMQSLKCNRVAELVSSGMQRFYSN
jgi:hypothetical protein